MDREPRFVAMADNALLIEYATEISESVSDQVLSAERAITAADIAGVAEVVPAFVNLLVIFDPLLVEHAAVKTSVKAALAGTSDNVARGVEHLVQVCYDESLGVDLAPVAALCSMSIEAVIASHMAGDYRVCMYGFAPGYAYMSGVAEALQVPRKTGAVRGVAAGSVIIAGPQCLITTLEMPTGWSILGRSPTRVLQDDPNLPVLFDLGDRVRFEQIDIDTYHRLESRP